MENKRNSFIDVFIKLTAFNLVLDKTPAYDHSDENRLEAYETRLPAGKHTFLMIIINVALYFIFYGFETTRRMVNNVVGISLIVGVLFVYIIIICRLEKEYILRLSINSEYLNYHGKNFPLRTMLRAYLFFYKYRSGKEIYLRIQYKKGYHDICLEGLDKTPEQILRFLNKKRGVKTSDAHLDVSG